MGGFYQQENSIVSIVSEALAAADVLVRASDRMTHMPRFSIRTINSTFVSEDDEAVFDGPDDALASGIQSGVRIAADEIASGVRSSAVEVCVSGEDGVMIHRSVVSLAVSSLVIKKSSVVPMFG